MLSVKELFRCYVSEESYQHYRVLDGAMVASCKLNAKEIEDENGRKCFVECENEGITYEFSDVLVVACSGCCELRFFDVAKVFGEV